MSHTQTTRSQKARFALTSASAAILMAGGAAPARAQAFADLKSALVDYSKADMAPRKLRGAGGDHQRQQPEDEGK